MLVRSFGVMLAVFRCLLSFLHHFRHFLLKTEKK